MAGLSIIWAPGDEPGLDTNPQNYPRDWRMANMKLSDDLDGRDIYEIARQLAELLLEQVSRERCRS